MSRPKHVMDHVFEVYQQNKTIDHQHLAELVSKAYEEYVLPSDITPAPPLWLPSAVLHHLKYHQVDKEFSAICDLRDTEALEKRMTDSLLTSNDDETGALDPSSIAAFCKLKSLKRLLLDKL